MTSAIKVSALHHVSFLVTDLEKSLNFYHNILGLQIDPQRPNLGYPGAWLKISSQQQIHLMQLPNPYANADLPRHGGRDRHVAMKINDFAALVNQLKTNGIAYTVSRSGRNALFCRDPDGNALEFIES